MVQHVLQSAGESSVTAVELSELSELNAWGRRVALEKRCSRVGSEV